jgi:hypothetical protein
MQVMTWKKKGNGLFLAPKIINNLKAPEVNLSETF